MSAARAREVLREAYDGRDMATFNATLDRIFAQYIKQPGMLQVYNAFLILSTAD